MPFGNLFHRLNTCRSLCRIVSKNEMIKVLIEERIMMNDSEEILSAFSELYFYKELVQSNLYFTPARDTEKQAADLLINAGDFIIAIQLKSRNENQKTADKEQELKWLIRQCKDAKRQVKESIAYIMSGELPSFENGRQKKIWVASDAEIIPLVVFMNDSIGDDYPHILCRHSDKGMDINCLSFVDFQKMCRVLLTPIEIKQYLSWRLEYFRKYGRVNISIFEDYNSIRIVKPTCRESLVHQFIYERYGMASEQKSKTYATDFSEMLQKLPEKVVIESVDDSSYPIILFFSHFDRLEIEKYVDRISKALNYAKEEKYTIVGSLRNIEQKYVIVFVSTHDGYAIDMKYLEKIARKKGDFDTLLQVYCYWESSEEFRIDFCLKDYASKYLK